MTSSASHADAVDLPVAPLFRTLPERLRLWHQRRRALKEARAAFMHTVYLDDRLLDDMGVTREEVLWAARLPLEQNAALALQARAAGRRAAQASDGGRR
ncbi:MAG: hypothetical protein R3F54_17645 [Alphaproteobacteria bacterium]